MYATSYWDDDIVRTTTSNWLWKHKVVRKSPAFRRAGANPVVGTMNNEVQKLFFVQEFFFKRLYDNPARARGENTYVQELVDEVKHTVDSCEDLFIWLQQNLDHYWATRFPWTVEVTGFPDIPYLKVTFDYKLNEKGELYVLDNWCSKNSLEIPDEYFSKSEIDVDINAHFNKEHNIIVFDLNRTEV